MKLFRFYYKYQQPKERMGIYYKGKFIDLNTAAKKWEFSLSSTLTELIQSGEIGLHRLKEAIESRDIEDYSDCSFTKDQIHYLPVVKNPEKIMGVAFNYIKHAIDYVGEIPTDPVWFNMFGNTLSAHNQDIPIPVNANKVDYEVELVIVIGKQGKQLTSEEAKDIIFGYTIGNDLSARDIQHRSSQWTLGKTMDYFSPTGPFIVTKDELEDPNQLDISLSVNGQVRQQDNTQNMIHSVEELVSYLSQYITLKPGDLIFSGSPSGMIGGKNENKYGWLQSGDVLNLTIEGIGTLTNRLI